jgi:hypothetical protein
VEEHVKILIHENAEAIPNPYPVYYPTGEILDRIGPEGSPGQEHVFLKTEQTFTAYKNGETYPLSTKINQYVDSSGGKVNFIRIDIIVP